jgi:hypothetical protein
MRKDKLKADINSWTFNPHLLNRQYKNNAIMEPFCPVIHASKIEKRTKMRIQMTKRWISKSKPKTSRVSKNGYSKSSMTQRSIVTNNELS